MSYDNMLFFCAGPPRSGTAWLSTALNFGADAFCFHELERDILDAENLQAVADQMIDRMHDMQHMFVGNCSSGLLCFGRIVAPLVIIHRDWDEVDVSLQAAFQEWEKPPTEYDIEDIKKLHEHVCTQNPHALHVQFEDLFTLESLVQIWRHCIRLVPPPMDNLREHLRKKIVLKEFNYPWDPKGNLFGIPAAQAND